jgi:hypothetical protein
MEIPYPPLFAVGGDLGEGRVLVLADHSVFINQMMLPVPPDNGNLAFAFNCLSWLRGERLERRRVLFVEDGAVQTKFDVPLKSGRLTRDEMLRALWGRRNEIAGWANDALDSWQQSKGVDEALGEDLEARGVSPPAVAKYALLGLTALLVVYGLYRLGTRLRHRPEKGLPALGAEPGGMPPVIEQRHLTLLRSGNVWEAARELTRQWFAARGAPPSGAAPRVESAGGWWRRRRVRALVGWLWRLAHAEVPGRVPPGRLRGLLRRLEELDAALARGSVRLVWQEAKAA